jgi:enterochelin esterase-like enzyme
MSLTEPALLLLLAALMVATLVWNVVAWPRASGPGPLAILRRVGRQLAVMVLALLTVGVALNDQYDWYANWADLTTVFSAGAPDGTIMAAGVAASAAAGAVVGSGGRVGTVSVFRSGPAGVPESLHLTSAPGPLGQYQQYTVGGPVSGVTGSVTVWFPPAYTDPAQSHRAFPVLETFHGIPGTPAQWAHGMHLGETVAEAAAAGRIAEPIIVMPNIAPGAIDTECVDGTGHQPRVETWLTKDVPDWVTSHLRVRTDRASWATLGLSAGAYCASMVTMLHPDRYSAAISLGGYYQPTFESSYVPFTAHSAAAQRYDLVRLAKTDPPPVALWMQTSAADPVSYTTTEELLRSARAPISITADVLQNAGHRLGVWAPLVPVTLQWLGASIPGFRPAAAAAPAG